MLRPHVFIFLRNNSLSSCTLCSRYLQAPCFYQDWAKHIDCTANTNIYLCMRFKHAGAYWLCLKRDCSSLINVYLICNSNDDALQFYWELDVGQTAIFPNFVLLAWPTLVQTFCAGIIILHSSVSSGFLGHSLCAGLYKQFASLWCLSEYIVSITIPALLTVCLTKSSAQPVVTVCSHILQWRKNATITACKLFVCTNLRKNCYLDLT